MIYELSPKGKDGQAKRTRKVQGVSHLGARSTQVSQSTRDKAKYCTNGQPAGFQVRIQMNESLIPCFWLCAVSISG